MMISKRSFCLAAAMSALLLTAPIDGASAQMRDITFVQPSPSSINSFPIYVAIGQGFFKDEGLNVRVESVNGSGPVIQALASGQAQFGRPGPGPILNARARGVDVVFLYNMMVKSSFGIVVKDGDSFRTPTDLKGKVIGVGTADGAEVSFARGVLSKLGMEEKRDYTFLTVGDGGMATAAFSRGDISAYAASTADAAILNYRGVKLRDITPVEFLTYFGNGFAVMQSTIDKDPKLVEAFGRAVVKAQEFAMDPKNRDAVLADLKAGMPQENENRDFANALFEQVLAKTIPLDESKGFGYQNPQDWTNWHTSLVETGSLKQPLPDLEKAYTNTFVEAWNK